VIVAVADGFAFSAAAARNFTRTAINSIDNMKALWPNVATPRADVSDQSP
jgi:hypothetical protein